MNLPKPSGVDWTCVTPKAPWKPRDSQGRIIHDGHMWMLGGWWAPSSANIPGPRDVWKSANGRDWTCVTECAAWEHGDLPATFSHAGKLWLMGGRKVPGTKSSNSIWSSSDGTEWHLEGQAAWCPRVCHAYAKFHNRLWIMGGTEDFTNDNQATLKNDVWSSENGIDWELITPHAAWSPRRDASLVVFQDKLWLMAGGSWFPETIPLNEVWCSSDGQHWELVTPSAPWAPRLWASLVVYRDHLWFFGGWSRKAGDFNDVWFSADGKNWTAYQSGVIWSPRHAQAAYVLNDRIYAAGGHAKPLTNEVWSLELPIDWGA